jgi:lactate dehydrogenase-like 2-hydroxyacid dehydrogenase
LPEEPPSNNNLLIKDFYENKIYLRNKLIITPHVAFYSNISIIEIRKKAAIEMKTVLQGGRAKNCVNNFYE